MKNEIKPIFDAYQALLSLGFDHNFRARNQDIYARLRDFVAEQVGADSQAIQVLCETMVAESKKAGRV